MCIAPKSTNESRVNYNHGAHTGRSFMTNTNCDILTLSSQSITTRQQRKLSMS